MRLTSPSMRNFAINQRSHQDLRMSASKAAFAYQAVHDYPWSRDVLLPLAAVESVLVATNRSLSKSPSDVVGEADADPILIAHLGDAYWIETVKQIIETILKCRRQTNVTWKDCSCNVDEVFLGCRLCELEEEASCAAFLCWWIWFNKCSCCCCYKIKIYDITK